MKQKCESCNGRGWGVWSCCTGNPVNRDIMMCPVCHEHLGEEPCVECDGTGQVDEPDESYEITSQAINQIMSHFKL